MNDFRALPSRDDLAAARTLHRSIPTIDLHADPLLWSRLAGYDLGKRHRNRLPRSPFWSHSDLPRWRDVNLETALLGVVTLPFPRRNYFAQARRTIELARRFESNHPQDFHLLDSPEAYRLRSDEQAIGGLLSAEGAHAFEGSFDNYEFLKSQGLRAVGLAHFHRNEAVAPSHGPGGDHGPFSRPKRAAEGLSDFGRELIHRLNRDRLLIDLAHTSRSGFLEAARLSQAPVFVSHTGVRGAHDHWRNLDDEQLRAVADSGGIIGIIFAGLYAGGSTIEHVLRHVEYVIELLGEDHVAIGSDFDGMIIPVRGLADVTEIPNLTAALLARGHSEQRLEKFLSGNARRFIESVTGWGQKSSAQA